jgi:hypothetical protein
MSGLSKSFHINHIIFRRLVHFAREIYPLADCVQKDVNPIVGEAMRESK